MRPGLNKTKLIWRKHSLGRTLQSVLSQLPVLVSDGSRGWGGSGAGGRGCTPSPLRHPLETTIFFNYTDIRQRIQYIVSIINVGPCSKSAKRWGCPHGEILGSASGSGSTIPADRDLKTTAMKSLT